MESSVPSTNLSISVIVPTHNSGAYLDRCLTAIRGCDGPPVELIVVDDASSDNSVAIAHRYADVVIENQSKALHRSDVRFAGFERAQGTILVNIDSDVVVAPNAITLIQSFFLDNTDADAVTGRLSSDCPVNGFFSDYKHLYMNYIFESLPARVTFLYGSIFAIRASSFAFLRELGSGSRVIQRYADDTELGLLLTSHERRIGFLPQLLVKHLKVFDARSLVKNDFQTPRYFAHLMWRFQLIPRLHRALAKYPPLHNPVLQSPESVEQQPRSSRSRSLPHNAITQAKRVLLCFLEGRKPAYLHSSRGQLAGIAFAYAAACAFPLSPGTALLLLGLWLWVTAPFFRFLLEKRSADFTLKAVLFTWVDHLIMGAGIAYGLLEGMLTYFGRCTSERDPGAAQQ